MTQTIADQIIDFNQTLNYNGNLPSGFDVLNPYLDNPETLDVMRAFYTKFYNDSQTRKFIIGINPSRHGAGVTGVPFTDTKRLKSACGIEMKSAHTHEISSVYLYDVIEAYGGTKNFYNDFFINSPFPLTIIQRSKSGQWLNANYYDDKNLFEAVKPFMIECLKRFVAMGLITSEVYVLGKKNATFIQKLNQEAKLFDKMVILEHPRYIQQYKSKDKQLYIDKYILALNDLSI